MQIGVTWEIEDVTVKKRLCAALCAGLMTAQAVHAQGYVCTLKTNGSSFAPEVLAIDFDGSGKTATVFGPVIQWAKGEPIQAKLRNRQDGKIEVRWSMTLPSRPFRSHARYRAVFDQSNKSLTLNATLRNADNDVSGRGTCAAEDWLSS